MADIGNKLKVVREKLGFTQDSIAQKMNVDKATYSRFENGKREPKLTFLERFIETTGVNANWLFLGKGDMFEQHVSGKEENHDIRVLYPNIPEDPNVYDLIECLQVPLVYHLIIADFILYRKKHQEEIDAYFLNEKEESHAGSTERRKQ
jgi:transcriptional regulator with XRE-family HTH domain